MEDENASHLSFLNKKVAFSTKIFSFSEKKAIRLFHHLRRISLKVTNLQLMGQSQSL